MIRISIVASFILAAAVALPHECRADDPPRQMACRSVHLWYRAPQGRAFYNELTIDHSAPGSYFMACGFNMGYFGIQELGNGKKVVLFSVWEPGKQNNAKDLAEDQRVKLLYKDPSVRTGRFGGEGTGGQSFLDFDWKIGETYRFFVTATRGDHRTEFAGYFFLPDQKQWKHLATFSTPAGDGTLKGYYSFIEDFRRNGASAMQVRQAHFGNGWIQNLEGQWTALTRAHFTADNNPATNINAGADVDRFFLSTGGNTTNNSTPLNADISRFPTGIDLPNQLLPKIDRPAK
jgi:uncharacterized protein DUF3472